MGSKFTNCYESFVNKGWLNAMELLIEEAVHLFISLLFEPVKLGVKPCFSKKVVEKNGYRFYSEDFLQCHSKKCSSGGDFGLR